MEKAGTTEKEAVLEQMKQTKDWPALNGSYSWRERDLCNSVFMVQCHADGTIEDKALVEG